MVQIQPPGAICFRTGLARKVPSCTAVHGDGTLTLLLTPLTHVIAMALAIG